MQKLVNGSVVDVNTELFEMAALSQAVGRTAHNKTSTKMDIKPKCSAVEVVDIVKHYRKIYQKLPFPLNLLDTDLKYLCIGELIAQNLGREFWVDGGLYVVLGQSEETHEVNVLYFVNDSWSVVRTKQKKGFSLSHYRGKPSYDEYVWLLEMLKKDISTVGFYNKFMPEFMRACNRNPQILKWELANILHFGIVPDKLALKDNELQNLAEEGGSLLLDIFSTTERPVPKKKKLYSMHNIKEVQEYKKLYSFEVYEKNLDERLKKTTEKSGVLSLFLTLSGIKNAQQNPYFEDYRGFYLDNLLVFEVDRRVFVGKVYQAQSLKEIASNAEIYSYDRGIVYLRQAEQVYDGILKEKIYSYTLKTGVVRLCKIAYINRQERAV